MKKDIMETFSKEHESLIVPLLSRIYTTKKFPHILYDKQALLLQDKLPPKMSCISHLVQYTMLSGAIRSKKFDIKIDDFLSINPDGIIIELGCSSSTSFYRCKSKGEWYAVDNQKVIDFRTKYFNPDSHLHNIRGDIFDYQILEHIFLEHPHSPFLIICCGVFSYYEKEKILMLLKRLSNYSNLEIVFDAINKVGQKRMKKFYEYLGFEDWRKMFFVDSYESFQSEIGHSIILDDEPFFQDIDKKGFKLFTRIYMAISDFFKMINIYHIRTEYII